MKLGIVISSVLAGLALLFGSGRAVAQKAGPPNVVGLKLPVASERLRDAGWIPKPFNTDTFLGIIEPSHYTVCHEYKPVGHKVRLLAQKYGC